MNESSRATRPLPLLGILILLSAAILIPNSAFSQTMTMSPHKLVLNAVGSAEDVQAIIGLYIPGGYTITDFEATLTFDDQAVAYASSMRYCYIDNNLLVGFDKEQLLANPIVAAMAGNTVSATVSGWFTVTNADGESYTQEFDGFDYVEIMSPGKNSTK